jgi:hypothetical protein
MDLDFVWQEMIKLSMAAIAMMTFIGLIPIGKTAKLNSTWFWKQFGVYVLVGVCIGGAFVPAIKTETPIMFGLISALFAHLGRKAVPKAIRQKIGSFLGALFGGKNGGEG